jgi:broad specificity phosphatase PhoE
MLVLFIRHGQVPAQDRIGLRTELALSEEGQANVRALAQRLRRFEIAAIFTSPLRRTAQTAEILAEGRAIPRHDERSLLEVNPGNWENRRFEDLGSEPAWKRLHAFRSGTRIPGGEMIIEVQTRVVTFLERVSHDFHGRTIAVVSHADVIRAAVSHYLGVPLDLSLRIEISPASLSVIELEDAGPRLILLNDTGAP